MENLLRLAAQNAALLQRAGLERDHLHKVLAEEQGVLQSRVQASQASPAKLLGDASAAQTYINDVERSGRLQVALAGKVVTRR